MKFIASKDARYRSASISLAFAMVLAGSGALAQTAGEIVPSDFAPNLQTVAGGVQFSGQAGTTAPPGAEALAITLSGVDLNGAFPEMTAANQAFRARLTRGRIPVSELFDATADLEAAYANAGFVLARVVLVAQELRDGDVLTVEVIAGFVEEVNTDAVPEEARDYVGRVTAPLVGKERLSQQELERRLLISADSAGLSLGSALSAGQRDGGTVVTLDGEFKRFTAFAGVDNGLSDDLGNFTLNLGAEANGLLKRGDVIYFRFSSSIEGLLADDVPYQAIAGGFAIPLGTNGVLFNGEVTTSKTDPTDPTDLTTSNFNRTSLRLSYPVIRTRAENWSTSFALDMVKDHQDQIGGARIYEDRLTIARFGSSYSRLYDGLALSFGGTLSLGLDAFGARTAAEAAAAGTPVSRTGSDADFSKVNINFGLSKAVMENFVLDLTGEAQLNFGQAMPLSEMFSVGGSGRVSGVQGSDARGDSGAYVRAQLSRPLPESNGWNLTPYGFVAAGTVSIENPTVLERPSTDAYSVGFGMNVLRRGSTPFNALSGNVEVSFKDVSNGSNDASVSFSLTKRF